MQTEYLDLVQGEAKRRGFEIESEHDRLFPSLPDSIDSLNFSAVVTDMKGETRKQKFVVNKTREAAKKSDAILNNNSKLKLNSANLNLLDKPMDEILANREKMKLEKMSLQKEDSVMRSTGEVGQLWAEKYEPTSYNQLITDELTCRNAMTWMKSWDPLVFRKEKKRSALGIFNVTQEGGVPVPLKMTYPKVVSEAELDYKHQRILVIAGDTGIGKTSLAKVIARQAGYNPEIIHACQELSTQKLNERIIQATQNNSISNFDSSKETQKKPTCLIIDGLMSEEFETGVIVNELVSYCQTGTLEQDDLSIEGVSEMNGRVIERSKPKPKKIKKITRPIIITCDNFYSKKIKPILAHALAIKVRQADQKKLIQRLHQIFITEKITIDKQTVKGLVDSTAYDIRGCLNTVQLIKGDLEVGDDGYSRAKFESLFTKDKKLKYLKDKEASIFDTLDLILKHNGNPKPIATTRAIVENCSTPGLVNDSIYHNFTKCRYFEQNFTKSAKLLDLLSFENIQDQFCFQSIGQGMNRTFYLSSAYFQLQIASRGEVAEPEIKEFPTDIIALKKRKRFSLSIVHDLMNRVREVEDPFRWSNPFSNSAFLKDVASYLFQLVHPKIRDVSLPSNTIGLLSSTERSGAHCH